MALSMAAKVAALPEAERRAFYDGLSARELEALPFVWNFWARPDQIPPLGEWRTWALIAGRGAGKTRTASEWIRAEVTAGRRKRLAVVGPTSDSLRRIQVEGPSGILATADPSFRPEYEPSIRRITWPNGAVANLYSAEEPDRLRGENSDSSWCDEICSWANAQDCWDMLQMGLRLAGPQGHAPQVLISTTPKPIPLLKSILASPSTVVTRASTMDNCANLDASTLAYLRDRYGNTSLGRQELDGELVEDSEGALWRRTLIEGSRVSRAPELRRVVVGIDPAASSGRNSDQTGIVAVGIDHAKHAFVLEDASGKYSPQAWATKAVELYRRHRADRLVIETNMGGEMAEHVLRTVMPAAPIKRVHATRGKVLRAEPVVALYEQGRVHHVGNFFALEDQMCSWIPGEGSSPDRVDALVWCCTELMLGNSRPAYRANIDIFTR